MYLLEDRAVGGAALKHIPEGSLQLNPILIQDVAVRVVFWGWKPQVLNYPRPIYGTPFISNCCSAILEGDLAALLQNIHKKNITVCLCTLTAYSFLFVYHFCLDDCGTFVLQC